MYICVYVCTCLVQGLNGEAGPPGEDGMPGARGRPGKMVQLLLLLEESNHNFTEL